MRSIFNHGVGRRSARAVTLCMLAFAACILIFSGKAEAKPKKNPAVAAKAAALPEELGTVTIEVADAGPFESLVIDLRDRKRAFAYDDLGDSWVNFNGGVSYPLKPIRQRVAGKKDLSKWTAPKVDLKELSAEAGEKVRRNDLEYRFRMRFTTEDDPENPGVPMKVTKIGLKVWQKATSPGKKKVKWTLVGAVSDPGSVTLTYTAPGGGGGSTVVMDLMAVNTDHVTGVAETSSGSICVAGVTRDNGGMPLGDHISVDADLLGSTDQALNGQSGPGSNAVAQDATPTEIVGRSVQAIGETQARNWDVNGDGSGNAINPAAPGESLSRVNAANPHGTQVGRSNVFAAIVPAGSNSLSYLPLPTGARSTLVANDISETNPGHTGFAANDVNRGWVVGTAADDQFRRAVGIWLLDSSSQPVGGFILPFPADVTSMEGISISPDGTFIGGGMVKDGVMVRLRRGMELDERDLRHLRGTRPRLRARGQQRGPSVWWLRERTEPASTSSSEPFSETTRRLSGIPAGPRPTSSGSYLSSELGYDTSMFVTMDLPSKGRQYVDSADPTMSYIVIGGSGENVLGEQQGFVARFEINTLEPTVASPVP